MRQFLKRCHSVQTNQLLKQLLDKIEENSQFINEKRKNVEFSITDGHSIVCHSYFYEIFLRITNILIIEFVAKPDEE